MKCVENKNYRDIEKEINENDQLLDEEPPINRADTENETLEDTLWDHDYARAVLSHAYSSRCNGHQLSDQIPVNFDEAVRSDYRKEWINAMNEEFDSHDLNKTWSIVDRMPGMNIFKTRWVYSIKYDEYNNEIAKARIVARGDKNKNEYCIEQTYSPVVASVTVKWILSVIHTERLACRQLDIKTAFLCGSIEEDIYLEFPDGLGCNNGNKVLKLRKALYGLKTASKSWHDRITRELKSIHFIQSVTDNCLFYMCRNNDFAILGVYVDDMILAANRIELLNQIIDFLKTQFRIKVSKLNNFLGMQIDIQGDRMYVSQKRYIDRVLKSYG